MLHGDDAIMQQASHGKNALNVTQVLNGYYTTNSFKVFIDTLIYTNVFQSKYDSY